MKMLLRIKQSFMEINLKVTKNMLLFFHNFPIFLNESYTIFSFFLKSVLSFIMQISFIEASTSK